MNKSEFVTHIATNHDMTKAEAEKVIDVFTKSVTTALAKKEAVSLVGFGNFESKHVAARTGRNPQTGAEMKIPAANRPTFKAGKALKDAVELISIFDS